MISLSIPLRSPFPENLSGESFRGISGSSRHNSGFNIFIYFFEGGGFDLKESRERERMARKNSMVIVWDSPEHPKESPESGGKGRIKRQRPNADEYRDRAQRQIGRNAAFIAAGVLLSDHPLTLRVPPLWLARPIGEPDSLWFPPVHLPPARVECWDRPASRILLSNHPPPTACRG